MKSLLDNVMWNCLAGPQARFSTGSHLMRRYAPGLSPIAAFPDPHNPDFAELEKYSAPGDHFYIDIWSGPAPAGWRIDREARMFKMVWDAPMPAEDAAPDAVMLRTEHAAQAVALATLTNPGPFGLRTLDLGEYFGFFDGGKLVAMAGERMEIEDLREISGICTHPDYQGRGLARKLTLKLVRREMLRGLTPYLHVMGHNAGARALFSRMGFRDYLETNVRVVTRLE